MNSYSPTPDSLVWTRHLIHWKEKKVDRWERVRVLWWKRNLNSYWARSCDDESKYVQIFKYARPNKSKESNVGSLALYIHTCEYCSVKFKLQNTCGRPAWHSTYTYDIHTHDIRNEIILLINLLPRQIRERDSDGCMRRERERGRKRNEGNQTESALKCRI